MTIAYHPGKANVVADALSKKAVSMCILSYLSVAKRPFGQGNSGLRIYLREVGNIQKRWGAS